MAQKIKVGVLGATGMVGQRYIKLLEDHPWIGSMIKNINISRQTVLLMVKRGEKTLMPRGDLKLMKGDRIIAYSAVEETLPEEE